MIDFSYNGLKNDLRMNVDDKERLDPMWRHDEYRKGKEKMFFGFFFCQIFEVENFNYESVNIH